MAVSGSFDFKLNRDQLIKEALIECGVLDEEESPTDAMNTTATRRLNMMLKAWQADGLQLWSHKEVNVFLEKSKVKYSLPADNYTESFTETAIRVAASSSDTTMEVDSTTGMTAADFVGVQVDDGTMHWTTVASVTDSDTFELTTGLDDDAAVDNVVYFYTTKAPRPLRMVEGVRRVHNGNDIPLYFDARADYWYLADKETAGTVYQVYFDPQLDNSELRVYQPSDNSIDILKMVAHFPFDDMDTGTDDFSFPAWWQEAVMYGLSYRLELKYKLLSTRESKQLHDAATSSKKTAMDYDVEPEPLKMEPDYGGYVN